MIAFNGTYSNAVKNLLNSYKNWINKNSKQFYKNLKNKNRQFKGGQLPWMKILQWMI